MSATSGGGGSVSEGSEAGGSSSTMSVSDSPSTSFQANLPENVTKITLSEETGVGYGADVTGSKINLSLDERQQKDGIVNVAFDYEEGTNRGGGASAGAGGVVGVGGGDFRSINGSDKKDKVPEAVNLELVNMVPYSNGNGTSYGVPVNGIPMKKDSEQVDMSTPYDEYFVPVNEHKKYMRGEKLYVTKDKRRPTSWRRCLSWIVACTVISVVLIVGILAGTGVILSQEPNLVKEASVGRNFGGSNLKPVTNKSPTPTAEMYMFVPRSIESEFVIDNLDFDPSFKDVNSTAYQQFATSMEDQLKMLLFDKETLHFGESDVGLRIVNISRDPFKVNYRIGWNYKQGVTNPPEPIKMEDVKKRLVESLARNQGYIDKYHIDREAIKVNHVINTCQIDNGGCSHICYYNYITQQFTCTCPTHLVLDSNGKNCVAWTGSSEDDDALPVPSHTVYPGMPYESTPSPVQEKEFGAIYEHGIHQHPHHHDHSEPSAEPEPIGGKHESTEEPAPEPTSEPRPGHENAGEHGHLSHDHGASAEPTPEPNAENKYVDHSVNVGIKEPSVEPTPEPRAEDKEQSYHFTHEFRGNEPSAEPTLQPTLSQHSEGRSHDHDGHSLYGFKDHKSMTEPAPEPSTVEPPSKNKDHVHNFMPVPKEQEPAPEPTPEPSLEHSAEPGSDKGNHFTGHGVYVLNGHESSSEPTAEPSPEPTGKENSEVTIHGQGSHFVDGLEDKEPIPQPTPEPAPEPNTTGNSATSFDHAGHSVHLSSDKAAVGDVKDNEPPAEPTSEPIPEPTGDYDSRKKGEDSALHHLHGHKDEEPTAEPSPEPVGEFDSTKKDHDSSGHHLYGHRDEEPTPKSEPTGDFDSTKMDHDSADHHLYGHRDEEPTPKPEPTGDFDSTKMDHDSADHHLYGHRDEEPTPKPEPTGEFDSTKKDHDSSGHHLYGHRDEEPTPKPEPTGEFDSTKKDHDSSGHHLYGHRDEEPTPKPEPTGEFDSTKTDHDSSGHHLYGHRDEEPTPKPEPTADFDSTKMDHDSSGHHLYGHRNEEPTPKPEPTGDFDSTKTDNDSSGHHLYGHRDEEPIPKPEPTGDLDSTKTDHDSSGHHLYGHRDEEPTPTPEPTGDLDSSKKQKDSVTGEFDPTKKDQDSVVHVLHGQRGEESTAEPEPMSDFDPSKKNHDTNVHHLNGHKDEEPTPEPTVESDSSRKNHDSDVHLNEQKADELTPKPGFTGDFHPIKKSASAVHTSEGHSQPGNTEPNPELTPEHSLGDTSRRNAEHTGTTIQSLLPNKYSIPSEQNQKIEPRTEDSTMFHPAIQIETDKQNKSIHHVPYLEDILIKQPSRSSENQNGTAQNPLENVELTAEGKPVIEEVIITEKKTTAQPELLAVTSANSGENPNSTGKSVEIKDDNVAITTGIRDSSTKNSGVPNQYHTNAESSGEITEAGKETSTDIPKIVEYSSKKFSPSLFKENHAENSTTTGSPGIESETKSNDTAQSGNADVILGQKTKTKDNLGITTIRPEIQYEYHTIPVTIFSEQPKAETKQKQEENKTFYSVEQSRISETDLNKSSSGVLNTERPIITETDHGNTGNVRKQVNYETATEQQPGTTTILSILTPEGVEKISEQLHKGKSAPAAENKTINDPQKESENNETTKSPEEISNNIKDEVADNEEFNTLIDKDYKNKDDGPAETSKYPNKSLKTEKEKKYYVKGEKTAEVTSKPGVTSEDFILQKHVNGNKHVFDLDYSLQNEHTTKHDGEVTVTDPQGIHVIPGVSLKPFGINNHDISVLQTVAPDFRTETMLPTGGNEFDTSKPDSKTKTPDIKEGEVKVDKDFVKFDKDYKYEKQKVSKKKELKKKAGGKDGKNVELEDGRRYFTEITKDDLDISHEDGKDVQETTLLPETVDPEIRTTAFIKPEAIIPIQTEVHRVDVGVTEQPVHKTANEQFVPEETTVIYVDQNGHMMVDEPTVKSTSRMSPTLIYDEKNNSEIKYKTINTTESERGTPGTVYDGISHKLEGSTQQEENTTFVIYENDHVTQTGSVNSTTAHPTIIIHGQSGNLQDGYKLRFSNTTLLYPGNATFTFNGTHPSGHFSFTNYTETFSNRTTVHPTIVIRGQSGALQSGYETRFGNSTFVSPTIYKTTNVYRIDNETVPGTVFDGHFSPGDGHYHMFTNASGSFVYTNATHPPFILQNGEFGNATGYVLVNNTNGFSVGPQSVVFRNSTVFAVDSSVGDSTATPNETINFSHQISPTFVSSGTAYKVNDYFGYISKCAAGQFQCVNGTSKRGSACISLSSKCDSIPDCSDGSDELGCIENGCPGNFQCSDGTCLKRHLVCNGIVDCSDGSDEKNCESWKCEFDEFQCPSGRCIPIVWQCDNKPDCDNHTDEYHCQTSCGNDEYLCPEGWCIPLTYKCNGLKECSNGEDEQLCDCSHEEFKCQTGGCVSAKQVCDGVDDCPDRSDEWDCVKLEPTTNLLKIRSPSGEYAPVCADSWLPQYSDEVCTSLGYFSSVPIENENNSTITTESSFYVLKNDTTADFNKKIVVNFKKGENGCSSEKMVEISCQEFSCGSRSMTESSSVEARLVGGMSATSGQWPSVSLLYNIRNFHSCTANVLTPRWVLASYNCLKMGNKNLNEQDWKFFGGSTVFEAEKENAETRKIVSIVPHPQVKFNQFLFMNDLALVELDRSLQFTSNLGAVCLPEQEIQPRQICVTAGWGMDTPGDKAIRQQLQYLPVPTMNLTECNSTEHYSGFITDDKICAGYNSAQKSLCYNEEGAPLMCVNDRGEWELQGVLSYHSNCGRGSHPSIFSSITPVKDWIKKTIGNSFERKALPVAKR